MLNLCINTKICALSERAFERHVGVYQENDLAKLMNGPIRKALGCIPDNVTWGGQSGMVFIKQKGDFMKPVSDIGQLQS